MDHQDDRDDCSASLVDFRAHERVALSLNALCCQMANTACSPAFFFRPFPRGGEPGGIYDPLVVPDRRDDGSWLIRLWSASPQTAGLPRQLFLLAADTIHGVLWRLPGDRGGQSADSFARLLLGLTGYRMI